MKIKISNQIRVALSCFSFVIGLTLIGKAQPIVTIEDPVLEMQPVGPDYLVKGGADLPEGSYVWILLHAKEQRNFWHPQAEAYINPVTKKWEQICRFGGPQDVGKIFEIAAITVSEQTHRMLEEYLVEAARTGNYYAIPMPRAVIPPTYIAVKKTRHFNGLGQKD